MPARGCMLVQVLTALEFGGEDKREKSSRLLHHIILASQKLIRPYVTEVLQAVLPALQDANPNVAANVITVVGVLSTVGSAQVDARHLDTAAAIGASPRYSSSHVLIT